MRYIGVIIALFALACVGHAQIFLIEDFDSGIPAGWTITDGGDSDDTWHGTNDYGGSTLDGSDFAFVDSDDAGSVDMDEILESPAVNATGYTYYFLEFDHYFNKYISENADVDVWDGSAWQNVASFSGSDIGAWGAPDHQNIDITAYANANLKVRFHYYDANFDWYWAVDNVTIVGSNTVSYCISTFSDNSDYTTNVTFAGINHDSGADSGYSDNTGLTPAIVSAGSGYTLNIDVQDDAGYYMHYVQVWFDWNQDGDFSDVGEYYDLGNQLVGGTPITFSTTVNVPAGAMPGSTRMRVIEDSDGGPGTISECGNGTFGETEDYTVIVDGCLSPNSVYASNITSNSATLNWTAPSAPPANGYEFYYSTSSTPPSGSGSPNADTDVDLTSLSASTTYYVWIRSDCGGGDFSDWTAVYQFSTHAAPCNITSLNFSGSSSIPTLDGGFYYFDVCKDDILTLQANATCTNCGSGTDYSWVINAYDGNGPVSYSDDVLDYDIDYASGYDAVLEIEGDNCYASYPLRFRASDGPEIGNISTTINGCTGAGTEITVGASGSSVEVEGYHGEVTATLGVGAETFIPDGPSCATQCYESSVTFTDFAPGASIENPGDIQYIKINMEHTFIGDMQITLEGPGGCGSAIILPDKYTIAQGGLDNETYDWPWTFVGFYCDGGTFEGYGKLVGGEWQTTMDFDEITVFETAAEAQSAVTSYPLDFSCSNGYYDIFVAKTALGVPNTDDLDTSTDACDETEWYNDSGEGWDYCWSDNASYAYAPTANSYVYEAGNVDYYDAAEASYTFMRVNPSDETTGTNFYHPYENFYSELDGCPLNGTWTIKVCDSWETDNGWIFDWELALDPGLLPVNWDYDVDVVAVDWSAITDAGFTGAYPVYDLIPEPDLGTGSYGGTFSVIDEFGCSSDASLSFDVTGMTPVTGLTAGDFVWAGFEGEEWNADTNNWFEYDGTDFHYASNFPEDDKNVYIVDYCGNPDPEIDNAEAYCHDLNIAAGKSLIMSSTSEQTLNISGDWNNEGTFDAGISTVNFNGDSDQNLSTVAPGGESFYNLSLNQDAGSQVIVNQDLTIINELNITSGIINTNTNTLYINNPSPTSLVGGNLSGNDGFIKGRLQRATDGSSTYNFPIGYNGYGAQGFDITPSGSGGAQVLAYMEPFSFAPIYIQAYCDVEVHPGGGSHIIGEGDPGYDGIPDKILFDLQSPLQWDVSNPGGGIASYDINVYPSGSQMISPVVSANGDPMLYLMKNGEPGNTGVPAGDQYPWFDQDGFLQCPTQTSLSGLTSFSKFNLLGASGTGSALPVELLSFDASYDEEVVNLTWATASERNNDFFEVQKSENAYDFVAIGQLSSLAPDGNSNTRLNYTLTDEDVNQGTYYYRLKQVDFDGTFDFSDIVSVNIDGSNQFAIYPNPVDDYVYIHFYCENSENPQVEIYDQESRLVHAATLTGMKGYNHATIDVSTLSNAVYTLTLITGDGVQQAKLVKQ